MLRLKLFEGRVTMGRFVIVLLAASIVCLACDAAWAVDNVWYSVVVPGWGQMRAGHFARGSLFLSAELVSLTFLGMSQIQYKLAVDQYDRARTSYLGSTYIGDAVTSYKLMHEKWEDAEGLDTYRRVSLAAAAGVWFVNVLDMVLLPERKEPLLSFEPQPGKFLVVGSVSF
jgi:hypothetical protein